MLKELLKAAFSGCGTTKPVAEIVVTADEIEQEIRRRVRDSALGTGHPHSSSHLIQHFFYSDQLPELGTAPGGDLQQQLLDKYSRDPGVFSQRIVEYLKNDNPSIDRITVDIKKDKLRHDIEHDVATGRKRDNAKYKEFYRLEEEAETIGDRDFKNFSKNLSRGFSR